MKKIRCVAHFGFLVGCDMEKTFVFDDDNEYYTEGELEEEIRETIQEWVDSLVDFDYWEEE